MAGALTFTPTLPPVVCSPTPITPISFSIFGGATFDLQLLPRLEDGLTVLGRSLQALGLSTSALAPIIKILKVLKALIDLVQAIATLNPVSIADALESFGEALGNFVDFVVFPVQLAKMVRGFLQVLLAYFQALKSTIAKLAEQYTNVNDLISRAQALGNQALLANALCAKERLDAKVAHLNAALATLGSAIALIQLLVCLVTGGEISLTVPTLDGNSLAGEVLDPIIAALSAILAVIPDVSGLPLEC